MTENQVKKRKGARRYRAIFFDRIEYEQWIFRSYRKQWGYMVQKVDDLTWIRNPRRIGGFGFAESIPAYCRRPFLLRHGLPFYPSKLTALLGLLRELRAEARRCDPDEREEFEGELLPSVNQKISRVQTRIQALRAERKK